MHTGLCEQYVKSLGLTPSGFDFLFRTRPHALGQQTRPEQVLIPYHDYWEHFITFHRSIAKWIRGNLDGVMHLFDLWHVGKGMTSQRQHGYRNLEMIPRLRWLWPHGRLGKVNTAPQKAEAFGELPRLFVNDDSYFSLGQTPVPPRSRTWILELSHDPIWAIWLAVVSKLHQFLYWQVMSSFGSDSV